ncbi:MAG: hypothetical protein FD180_622 [Planctomycetota bacterium]|nr:MAG: hypothetical protein FD180_622 [Planctomycetota bacterium]
MKVLLALAIAAIPAIADDAAALQRDLAKERLALAVRCEKDGLLEEALFEWIAALRQDPLVPGSNQVKLPSLKPYVLAWDDALHEKYLAYSKDRAALLDRFAARWLALGETRAAIAIAPAFEPARDRAGEIFAGGSWVPKADAERLLQDLLPIDGKWLPAEEVRKRRSAWAEAWEVRGTHFAVRSNRSESAAREVLALAESVLAAVYRELEGKLDAPAPKKLLAVYDFATRADFLAHLDAAHDGGGDRRVSAGFFSSLDGASHFAPVGNGLGLADTDVERHEVAHQVCDAMWPPQGLLAQQPHFWAWEGVAAFFESTEVRDGKILVGSRQHPRIAMARRALKDGLTLPLDEFVQLDGEGIKGRYNQAASLVHFFMLSDGGKNRERFLKYLRVVASGKAEADSFEKCFGATPGKFQADWEAWVKGTGR